MNTGRSLWNKHILTDVAFFQEGPGLRTYQWAPEGMKVINVTNILGDGSVDVSNTDKYIAMSEFEGKYAHFAVEEKDIVIASSGNTYGKVGRIYAEHLPLMMNTSVIRFHSMDTTTLHNDFLYAWLRSPEFISQVEGFVTGGAQPNFGPTHLKQMSITLPKFHIQEKVANILSAYDDLIENNRRRMALLEESARQLYQEWFVRLRYPGCEHTRIIKGVPEGWAPKTLSDICDDVRETVSPEELEPEMPYIGLEHIPRRSISLSEWGRAEEVTSTKHRFRAGEILFGKIRPYFHKVGIAFVDGVASSDAIVIRPATEELRSLVLTLVSSDVFIAQASQTMREGSKMPRADWKLLKQYPVAVPPAGILNAFNSVIQPTVEQLKTLTFQNQKLRTARDLLLPRLMNGEIAV
jgi:type I restriction enzyme S subunit